MDLPFVLTCSSPLHGTRKSEPGWAAELGRSDRPLDGHLCAACARLDSVAAVAAAGQEQADRARLAALQRKGWAQLGPLEKDEATGLVVKLAR